MSQLVKLAGVNCSDGAICPGIWLDTDSGDLVVVGTDAPAHAALAGPGEAPVRLPRALLDEAVAKLR